MNSYLKKVIYCFILGILFSIIPLVFIPDVVMNINVFQMTIMCILAMIITYYLNIILKMIALIIVHLRIQKIHIYPFKSINWNIQISFDIKQFIYPQIYYDLEAIENNQGLKEFNKRIKRVFYILTWFRFIVVAFGCFTIIQFGLSIIYMLSLCFTYLIINSFYKKDLIKKQGEINILQVMVLSKQKNNFLIQHYENKLLNYKEIPISYNQLIECIYIIRYYYDRGSYLDENTKQYLVLYIKWILEMHHLQIGILERDQLFQLIKLLIQTDILDNQEIGETLLNEYMFKDWGIPIPKSYYNQDKTKRYFNYPYIVSLF